jgi:hypothetical protein
VPYIEAFADLPQLPRGVRWKSGEKLAKSATRLRYVPITTAAGTQLDAPQCGFCVVEDPNG